MQDHCAGCCLAGGVRSAEPTGWDSPRRVWKTSLQGPAGHADMGQEAVMMDEAAGAHMATP